MGPDQEMQKLETQGVPDDIRYLVEAINESTRMTQKVYDVLRRQEAPSPTVINLNPGFIFRTTVRMRCIALVFSGGTAGEDFALTAGRGSLFDWFVPTSPAPFTLPLSIAFDAGIDYQVASVTTPAAVNWKCRMLAYVELEG
jgi:hypothetical protein